jgi:VanZ family protein
VDETGRAGRGSIPDGRLSAPAAPRGWWEGIFGRWLPPLAWMGLIFYLSAQPDLPHAPEPLLDLILKKGAHALVYAVLATLWQRALNRWVGGASLSWLVAVLYAVTDEIHQTFVPGRHGRATDVLIDGMGAATGLLFMARLRRRARS